jgi:hypothetical protein
VTVSSAGNGNVSPSGAQTVNQGSNLSIVANPATGYHFVTWSSTAGLTVENNTSASTKVLNVMTLGTITANFSINLSGTTKSGLEYPDGGELFHFGDTITIFFSANGDSVSSVRLQVTSDNGVHYFKIVSASIPITGSGLKTYTQKWIIGKEAYDTLYRFLYADTMFGSSTNLNPSWKCNMKISASDNETVQVKSGDLTIKFTTPYFLRFPLGGEVYTIKDSIPVIYTFRDDSMAVIQSHYWSIARRKWSQIVTYSPIPAQDDWHLKTEKRYFIPADTVNNLDPLGDSTKIMIIDYSVGSKQLESGWIKINR